MGLFDAVLVKENHIVTSGSVAAAVAQARSQHTNLPIEIEVESIEELREALAAGADRLLLDNFDTDQLRQAVAINQQEGKPPADLEASGDMTLDTVRAVAKTGVNYISIGALTKHVDAVNLSLRFKLVE